MFRQVLINLIDNAVKYTDAGGRIAVELERRDGQIRIAVADTGIGMTPEEIETCRVPFGRSRDPMVRRHVGSGLGLAVVYSIVQRHGARIQVQSAKGEGTTVTVTIPAERIEPAFMEAAAD